MKDHSNDTCKTVDRLGFGLAINHSATPTCSEITVLTFIFMSVCIQKVGCDNQIGSNAVLDRCGVCNGDGSTCDSSITRNLISNSSLTGSKKDITPSPAKSLLITALNALKNLGYNVDRRGQIANPNTILDEGSDEPFYWGVVKSGCSVSCGGGM